MKPNGPTMLKKGVLIVFEGIDGAGKSSQIKRLARELRARGLTVAESREPTDSPYGRRIREIATRGRDGVSPEEEVELFVRDRALDVEENIVPVLEQNGIVLLDRYFYSNIAYQGALGLAPAWIREQNRGFPTPDLVLLFDLPPEVGIERIQRGRGEENNRGFEQLAFLEIVRDNYLALEDPCIERIDAAHPSEEVYDAVRKAVESVIRANE